MSNQEDKPGFGLGEVDRFVNAHRVTRRGVLKGALAAGGLAALAPLASACGGSDDETTASPSATAPKTGGHIRSGIGGGSSKDTLDAHLSTTETQIGMQWQLYDALMGWDPQHNLVMQLAESYEPNADATEHTVTLKSGLTWHDGKPVTADDVVFSFQRILDPKTGAIGTSTLTGLSASGIKKVDDLSVTFTLDQSNVIFFEALAYYNNAIVPVGYAPKGIEGAIGTGPWKIVSHNPGEQAVFAANPDYWGEGPYAEKLTLIEFSEPTAKLNALLGGSVDHISIVDASQAGVIQGDSGLKMLQAKTGGWNPFTMRIDVKPFDDVRVRQAFRLIVDRQQMIDQAWSGVGWMGNDMYAPFDPGYPADLAQRQQDLEQAKSLLKQAGYDNDLTVELVTSTAVSATAPAAAQVFAEQAKGAGVTVNVKKVDPGVFYGDQYLKWDFAQDFWATRNYLPQVQVGTLASAAYNETHWADDEWQALIDKAFQTVDEAERNSLVAQAMTIEYERGGLIIPVFNIMLDAFSTKLQGVVEDTWGADGAAKMRYNLMYFA